MLSHKSWGVDCRTLLLLYIALIKPKIDYGVEAYGSAKQHLLELLNPIQNEAIRIATGAFRSSPVKSLYAISGLKPPETYRDIKILNYAFRTIVNQSNPLHDDLVRRKNRVQENDDEGGSSFIARACRLLVKYNMVEDEIVPEGCSSFPPWKSP